MENTVIGSGQNDLLHSSSFESSSKKEDEMQNHDLNLILNESKPILIEELIVNRDKIGELPKEINDEITNLMVEEFTDFPLKPTYPKQRECKRLLSNSNDMNSLKSRCCRCDKLFPNDNKMRKHVLLQHSLQSLECYHCSYKAKGKLQLYQHMITHFPSALFYCDFCAERFQQGQNLFSHLEKHMIDRFKFTCAQCENTFASKLSLTIHLRTHTGEKPYSCSFCSRKFTQLASKRYHEKTHTGASSHFCEFCKKGFKSKFSRDAHQRIHTGERPFQCSICEATFRSSMTLRQHKLVHSDLKPFTCEICGKSFNRKDKVRVHMRIHTGDKPFACVVCSKRFCQKNDMLKHERIHAKKSIIRTKAHSPVSLCYNGQIFEIQD